MNGWIGIDLDSTLAHYDEWRGVEHIGQPIQPMVDRVKRWVAEGYDVRIFTARVDGGTVLADDDARKEQYQNVARVKAVIEAWCMEHIGFILPITNVKDYGMWVLYDDRCVQVEKNTGRLLGVPHDEVLGVAESTD